MSLWTAPDVGTLLKNACEYSLYLSTPVRMRYHENRQGDAEIWVLNSDPINKETHVTRLGISLYIGVILEVLRKTSSIPVTDIEVQLGHFPYDESLIHKFEECCNCRIALKHPVRKNLYQAAAPANTVK